MPQKIKLSKRILLGLFLILIILNVITIFHSYKFTHFVENTNENRTKSASKLNTSEKISALIFGVNNPKPKSLLKLDSSYQINKLRSNVEIEILEKTIPNSKGIVLLFHGYTAEKNSLLKNAEYFNELGYSTILTDFMGCGNSEGNQTTIGYFEAKNVETVFKHAKKKNTDIILYGNSMGSASLMRAISELHVNPQKVIIECPFATMLQTVENRFKKMDFPSFPMAHLLIFWGGTINGFWAFDHNPADYSKNINQPTLLLYGAKDKSVQRFEIDAIFKNLNSKNKTLKIFHNAGHENYINHHSTEWKNAIRKFLISN